MGGSSDNGGTTHTALVAEESSGDTISGCHHHGGTYESSASCRGVEGRIDDQLDGWPHIAAVDAENDDAAQHIEHRHERHEDGTDLGNHLHTSQDNQSRQQTNKDTDNPRGDAKCLLSKECDGVGLNRTADTERCQRCEDGKEHTQPFHAESTLQSIHRTAVPAAVLSLHTIFYSEQSFCIFRRHAEDTCQPAPEYSTRTAEGHSSSHSHNISRSDSGCQRRCQRSKLTDITFCLLVLLDGKPDGRQEFPLRYAQTECQEDVST